MSIISEIFSWWGGNTWGTRLTLLRQGRFVGSDELGNRYYEQKSGIGEMGMPRRWVVYTDLAEASKIGPDWHGWIHHMTDTPPTAEDYHPKPWQKSHKMNMTGTADAYRPAGSILGSGVRPKATGDYKPWRPT
jgi:NADH:ubiquinone oxidoreductase subunit